MFVYSFKASKKKMRLGILVLIGLIAAILIVVLTGVGGGDTPAQAQETAAQVKVTSNEERVNYLKGFGWEVNPMPVSSADVTIPKTFDAVYEEYNVVQKNQGMDLEAYKGKIAKKYSYTVTNYPNYEGAVQANLLIYDNQVIAGDVSALALDGFMHGLSPQS